MGTGEQSIIGGIQDTEQMEFQTCPKEVVLVIAIPALLLLIVPLLIYTTTTTSAASNAAAAAATVVVHDDVHATAILRIASVRLNCPVASRSDLTTVRTHWIDRRGCCCY